MEKNYRKYEEILKRDLFPALGCTEPIALALAGAKTRELLGGLPESAEVYCSGNIIKNVKAVTIPNSGGRRGIEAAVAMGLAGGDSGKALKVLEDANEECAGKAERLLEAGTIRVHLEEGVANLYIRLEAKLEEHTSLVELKNHHSMFSRIELDGQMLVQEEKRETEQEFGDFAGHMTPESILAYVQEVPIMEEAHRELRELLKLQADCNVAIGREGIRGEYGAAIGKMLLEQNTAQDPLAEGIAVAAGGSDARMSGCKMPVVINSGSGNQGMTIACPIAVYWKASGLEEEKLYRALLLANLLAICEKYYIGKLSAYCGAVSAAAAAGAGIAYLMGMSGKEILHVVSNALAIGSGILCDGAKASCAAKIAASLNCTRMALDMAKRDRDFCQGEGIVFETLEKTIQGVGYIAREGMGVTDEKILKIMLENPFAGVPEGC